MVSHKDLFIDIILQVVKLSYISFFIVESGLITAVIVKKLESKFVYTDLDLKYVVFYVFFVTVDKYFFYFPLTL